MTELEKKWQEWKKEKLKSEFHSKFYPNFPKAEELLKERKEAGHNYPH